MNRIMLRANVVLVFGTLLMAGCIGNGAVEFDSKCSTFERASVSKNYFIEHVELRSMADLLSQDEERLEVADFLRASSNDVTSVSNSLGSALAGLELRLKKAQGTNGTILV